MKKVLEIGGFIAGAVLIVFGDRRDRARRQRALDRQLEPQAGEDRRLAGHDPGADQGRGRQGRPDRRQLPDLLGRRQGDQRAARARAAFAQYMRIHALEATGGLTYAEMGRYATADGKPSARTTRRRRVQKNGQPVANSARDVWVTETALTTALNMSYMATQLSLFSIVIGVALLLAGDRVRRPRLGRAPQAARGGGERERPSRSRAPSRRSSRGFPPGSRERWGAERSAPPPLPGSHRERDARRESRAARGSGRSRSRSARGPRTSRRPPPTPGGARAPPRARPARDSAHARLYSSAGWPGFSSSPSCISAIASSQRSSRNAGMAAK